MSKARLDGLIFPTPKAGIIGWDRRVSALDDEFLLELEHVPVPEATAVPQIELSSQNLKLFGQPVKQQIEEIEGKSFYTLFKEATEMTKSFPGVKYVTGVKIHFGVSEDAENPETGGKIVPIFQPILMHRDKPDANDFNIVDEGNYYYYDQGNFHKYINPNDVLILKNRYIDNIQILHYGTTTHSSYDPLIDVEATIFPFQTIYSLIIHNLNSGSASVYLNNAIREIRTGTFADKHCLLLGTKDLGFIDFINKYANRSHLCPPCKIDYVVD